MSDNYRSAKIPFADLEEPLLESLNQLQADFVDDKRLHKVDLMVGSYCEDSGQNPVLESVRLAKERIFNDLGWSHGYPSSHLGEEDFRNASLKLLFGVDSHLLSSSRVASMQALGGSGACHMGALFLQKYHRPLEETTAFIPKDSWVNHCNIFRHVGIATAELPYFNADTKRLDVSTMLDFLKAVPEGSIIVLQVCGNNPTGCDLGSQDWADLAVLMQSRSLFAYLDVAYQGFVSGDVEQDCAAIRILAAHEVPLLVAATYSKAFGLYGERVGHLCITAQDSRAKSIIEKHMKLLARAETGAQPRFGALIVSTILGNHDLLTMWKQDVFSMAESLRERRRLLLHKLKHSCTRDWTFAAEQCGMFLYTGLRETQIMRLRVEHAVYMQDTGRISIAGLTASNVEWVARSLLAVTDDEASLHV